MSAAPGTPTTPLPRRRRNTLLAVLLVIALGAPARLFSADLPVLYTQFIGDALWALMIYLLWALLLPRSPVWVLALLTLGIAWGIEFSQLLHTPLLGSIRSTRAGRLLLGSGFLWSDMLACALGAAAGLAGEWGLRHQQDADVRVGR